jgi:hypothetical protein
MSNYVHGSLQGEIFSRLWTGCWKTMFWLVWCLCFLTLCILLIRRMARREGLWCAGVITGTLPDESHGEIARGRTFTKFIAYNGEGTCSAQGSYLQRRKWFQICPVAVFQPWEFTLVPISYGILLGHLKTNTSQFPPCELADIQRFWFSIVRSDRNQSTEVQKHT